MKNGYLTSFAFHGHGGQIALEPSEVCFAGFLKPAKCRHLDSAVPWGMVMLDRLRRAHRLRAIEMRYGLVIYWSEVDSTFLVQVPELPGCMADGATYEEAVANAQAVISGWLETAKALDRPIPEPKGRLIFFES